VKTLTRPTLAIRLARREALALTLIPDDEAQGPLVSPQLLLESRTCPWCPTPAPRPPRSAGDATPQPRPLPIVTALSCEMITLRSLLCLNLLRARTDVPLRVLTRAAFWSGYAKPGNAPLSEEDIWLGLHLLDRAEAWWDDVLAALAAGARTVRVAECEFDRVLPMSSRVSRHGAASDPPGVLATLHSLHFLTPHAQEPLLDRLNRTYLSVRLDAVRALLEPD
jgi:hypothetical protein